jgi:shikimate dehydrogenase
MKRFALIGKPLGHSLSPEIHALISEIAGLPCAYELRPLEPHEVRAFIRNLQAEGLDGMNATIPYKLAALESVDSLSPEAAKIGAVNTVEVAPGGLVGHNTDYHGFGAMLDASGIHAKGRRCVILGSGGGAKAVAAYLADAGASELTVASIEMEDALARFPGVRVIPYEELCGVSGDLLVNTTPVGMHPRPEGCPVPEAIVGRFAAAADLVYNPRETQFLAAAARLGLRRADGLYMLAAQAVRAREIWHGARMGAEVELRVYERLDRALREGGR